MQIKKYQSTPGPLPKPIATSDMTSHVAAMPLRQQRNDVEQQTLNTNRMRSFDAKEREAGQKAEVQRRKQKRQRVKQTANPHVDAATIQDNQFAMNVGDAAIEQQVAQEAERNNPYGAYRLSLNQGTLKGLSDAEAEERMGFFANLGDALGVTNARHDANRSLAARMADQMLWNLDSRNPSGGLQGVVSNPAIMTMGAAGLNYGTLLGLGSTLFGASIANHLTYPFTGKTIGQHIGDYFPIITGKVGDNIIYGIGTLNPSTRRMLSYANERNTWYSPFEYMTAHTPQGRRIISMAMNTTDAANPTLAIKTGIKESDLKRKVAWGKYILTGKGTTPKTEIAPGLKINDPTAGEGYYASFNSGNNMEGGLINNYSTRLTPKRRLIEGTELEPELFTRIGGSNEHGVLTEYTHRTNPQYKNAVVYETNLAPSTVKQPEIEGIRSLGTLKRDINGELVLWDKNGNQKGWYNSGGHQIEVRIDANGNPVERSWDIYKFNPHDYRTRWFGGNGKYDSSEYTKLADFGVNTVEEATKNNVFIVRTPWYFRNRRGFYDSTK